MGTYLRRDRIANHTHRGNGIVSAQQLTLFADPPEPALANGAGQLAGRPPKTREELDAIVNAIPESEIISCKWERVANGYMGPFCEVAGCIEMMFWTDPQWRRQGRIHLA